MLILNCISDVFYVKIENTIDESKLGRVDTTLLILSYNKNKNNLFYYRLT